MAEPAVPPAAGAAVEPGPSPTPAGRRGIQAILLLVALAFAAAAVASQWDDVRDGLDDLTVAPIALGAGAALASLLASMAAWRETLAGLGHRLPARIAARVFFLGQLAKYVPGSIWSIVGQAELAKVHGVPRARTATAGVVVLAISVTVALGLGGVAVPALLSADGGGTYAALVLLVVPLGAVLHPAVLNRLVAVGLRVLRRPPLEAELQGGTILRVAAWSVLTNGLLGVQIWLLALDLGGGGIDLAARSIGGFGLATALGLLFMPLPAGAGVREAVLVLLLAPEIGSGSALLVALVARLVLTLLDVGVAAGAAAASRGATPFAPPSTTP